MKNRNTFWFLFLAIFWLGCDYGPMDTLTEEEQTALEEEEGLEGLEVQRHSLTSQEMGSSTEADREREDNGVLTPATNDSLTDLDDGEQCATCDPVKNGASVDHGNPQPWDGPPED